MAKGSSKGQSLGQDAVRRILKDRVAVVCLTVIIFYSLIAILCTVGLIATNENEPVAVVRDAWVDGEWKPYTFVGGANEPPLMKAQTPKLEYQPPSLVTRLWAIWAKSALDPAEFRTALELGPVPTNQDLADQIAAYQAGVADEAPLPPAITIPKGDYERRGNDGLYPDERAALPGWFDFILGTDFLGRDVFKRVIHGTRIAMSVGFVSCVIAIPIGTFFGAIAGFYGGKIDEAIVLLYSTVASVPGLLLLLAFVMVLDSSGLKPWLIQTVNPFMASIHSALGLGNLGIGVGAFQLGRSTIGLISVYVALGMTSWVSLCRLVRGEFIKHKDREYVVAAQSLGATNFSCIFKHILPNVFHILIINFSLRFVYAVQSEVILSYLGVGVSDQPSWGVMINDAKLELARGVWWQLAAATAAMFVVVLALNIFGDILRDALDPKLRD